MYRPNLLITNDLLSNYVKKFETVFSVLPDIDHHAVTGRPPHPKSAILNALIFKNLRSIKTLTELSREISFYPAIAQLCGFRSIPSKERFSSFIRSQRGQFNRICNLIPQGLLKTVTGPIFGGQVNN